MAQSLHLREQTERRRRLAGDCTDLNLHLRGSLLRLAEEYAARAGAQVMTTQQFGRPARTTRTTDWLAAIGVGCGHQPRGRTGHAQLRSTNEPAALALVGYRL